MAETPADLHKAENEMRTAELRAKLLDRPNTAFRRANATASDNPPNMQQYDGTDREARQPNLPSDDLFSPQNMLAAVKGSVRAQAEHPEKGVQLAKAAPTNVKAVVAPTPSKVNAAVARRQSGIVTIRPVKEERKNSIQEPMEELTQQVKSLKKPIDLNNPDVNLWLEITGYHDVEFRNGKLASYKERQQLEREAAKIDARIQKLNDQEAANETPAMRFAPSAPKPNQFARPSSPAQRPRGMFLR